MVKLTKIYTRTGDEGETGIGDGSRVSKIDARVAAYGTVDEANAFLGVAATACGAADSQIVAIITRIQNDLFDVGADLCTPRKPGEHVGDALRVTGHQTMWLESQIDELNADLGSLTSFVLPGGTPLAAHLHVARTVVRRAEREVVLLGEQIGRGNVAEPIRYLNRLSDLLFVMARFVNKADGGPGDVLWIPGGEREPGGDPQ
ncbi:MAG: cob(I)yrinic acid a,c-diamide adenosyltransferase [Phycisphaerales bacterium]|nr:cob(I)yrinic acid a,c-diamide adenosyltransferase [Phycisphaerales bacterium]MCB9835673.1 cob(I)yrinic acid a,c-diamide adenosyltransferase [Phycisphaera sp.]